MKFRIIVFICIILLIVACSPPVVFDQAYPIGEENLDEIPESYNGSFICESDSSLLLIKKHEIVIRKENFFDLPVKFVEQSDDCTLDGQEMYVSSRDECIPLIFVNDSTIRGTVVEHDTLFSMSEGAIVRMYQGHVVLSNEINDDQWAVSFLSLEKNSDVKYRAITDKTKIGIVGEVTKMEDITTFEDKENRYMIKPTMKQFDQLFNDEKVFIECEYLTRVSLESQKGDPIILKDFK